MSNTVFDADASLSFRDFDGDAAPTDNYDPDAAIRDQVGSSSPFAIEYYSSFFDVDARTVLARAWRPLNPLVDDYVSQVLLGQPDLYGPFWLPTTLILVLFLSASLASSISAYFAGNPYSYDFSRLTIAVSTVYGYSLVVPLLVWAAIRYWAKVDDRSPAEIISLYGYGMVAWIFAALLSIPPLEILRYVVTVLAFASSLYFLVRNLYPPLASSTERSSRLLVFAIVILHIALTATLWIAFLDVGQAVIIKTPDQSS